MDLTLNFYKTLTMMLMCQLKNIVGIIYKKKEVINKAK